MSYEAFLNDYKSICEKHGYIIEGGDLIFKEVPEAAVSANIQIHQMKKRKKEEADFWEDKL